MAPALTDGGFDQHGKSHTKQLVIFGVVAIIIALVAAIVFQSFVPSQQRVQAQGFSEDYCLSLLAAHYPPAADSVFYSFSKEGQYNAKEAFPDSNLDVKIYGTNDGRVAGCEVNAVQFNEAAGFENSYECSDRTVRYKADEKREYLFLFIENELPERMVFDGTVLLDYAESSIPRFSQSIFYINPSERAFWEELIAKLRNREC